MLVGFEKETHELRDYELLIIPVAVHFIKYNNGKQAATTSNQIIKSLAKCGIKVAPCRLRKMINYIRTNGVIENLVASSKGYYIAESESECRRFVASLDQRANSIILVRDAMKYQMEKTYKNPPTKTNN